MNASVEVAVKLEDVFDQPFSDPVAVMEGAESVRDGEPEPDEPDPNPEDEPVHAVLAAAGFVVHPTRRAPFSAVGEGEEPRSAYTVLSGGSAFTKAAKQRAELMASIGRVTQTRAVYFTEDDAGRESIAGTALVSRAELTDSDPERVRDLIRERSDEPTEA